jgi:hypothetical protein
MGCDTLQAFAVATENLGMDMIRVPADPDIFNGAIPKGTYDRNKGVVKTTYTMQHSEPNADSQPFTVLGLDQNGQVTPICNPTFVEADVDFIARTYSPKILYIKGPEICRESLDFDHNVGEFLAGYVSELGRWSKRVLEFAQREDYIGFATVVVDPAEGGPGFYPGPNAWGLSPTQSPFSPPPSGFTTQGAAFPVPQSDLTQDTLDLVADYLLNVGATDPDSSGYVTWGGEGPVFPLLINRIRSSNILKNNSERRQDARAASMGLEAISDLSLFKRLSAGRVIANFRHMPVGNAPRAIVVGGKLVRVNTYNDVTVVGPTGQQYTNQYLAAGWEAAIVLMPQAMTSEFVLPYTWEFPDAKNYMGEWDFIVGGERIDPSCYDPLHDRGRHFGQIKYAPKPVIPYHAVIIWYQRCSNITTYAYCNAAY